MSSDQGDNNSASDIEVTANAIRELCYALQSAARHGLCLADLLPGIGGSERERNLAQFTGVLRRTVAASVIAFSVLPADSQPIVIGKESK